MTRALILLCLLGGASAATQQAQMNANPIRRLVTMMQKMEKKVIAEGEAQEKAFNKYMCYCETSEKALGASIAAGEEKVPQVESQIEELTASEAQLTSDLAAHQQDRADAKGSIGDATGKREEEAAQFAKESGDYNTNIKALGGAIPAIEQGLGGSFVQTSSGRRVQKLLQNADLQTADASVVTAFLQGGASMRGSSGEIVGILKQMKEDMEADLKELTAAEDSAIATFNELVAAKEKEIAAATAAIEDKSARKGETSVSLANAKHDLSDTSANLADDQKFLADMKGACGEQEKAWEQVSAMRTQEVAALNDVITMLNSDDALELFKKTLSSSSASFLQTGVSSKAAQRRALAALRSPKFNFIALALRGKKAGFEKVLKMIDEMSVVLDKEQEDDNAKKEWCGAEFDKTDDAIKEQTRVKGQLEAQIAEAQDALKALAEEIEALSDGISALDRQVADATANRKEAHSDYVTEKANNNAALNLLGVAKNRMNKFYNPAMHKAPQTPVPTEEQRQYFAATGEIPPELTPAPEAYVGKESFVQIRSSNAGAPPPPPAAIKAFKKQGGAQGGVMGMMDSIINDVKSEMQANDAEEKAAQKEYEGMMADAAKKRADDSETMTNKETAKADTEEELEGLKHKHSAKSEELVNTKRVLADTHGQCDWLLENFDSRKAARADEKEALSKGKAVLSGADYSFVQQTFLSRRA